MAGVSLLAELGAAGGGMLLLLLPPPPASDADVEVGARSGSIGAACNSIDLRN